MFKKNFKRKVFSLVIVAMLFSSSVSFGSGFASTYRFVTPIFNNIQWRQVPIFSWFEANEPEPIGPVAPKEEEEEKEIVEEPEAPVEEVERPVEERPIETPEEKPVNSEVPRGVSSEEEEVLRLVNIERQKAGLSPFTLSTELSNVARDKSKDMAHNNYFSHQSPRHGSPFDMMKAYGINYRTAGENIAKGYNSAASVVNGWMNSSGHRANILNSSFNTLGVGYYNYNGTAYWTQMFTN